MTTANKVTILRILLIPFFVVLLLYYVRTGEELYRLFSLLCFALAAICDGVDGYIARRYNQRSELGALLDPLADKLLLISGIVLLSCNVEPRLHTMPLWFPGIVLGRDVLMIAGLGLIYITVGKVKVRPRWIGKIATVLQMSTVIWTILKWDEHWLWRLTFLAAVVTAASAIFYLWDGIRQLSSHPASAASPPGRE